MQWLETRRNEGRLYWKPKPTMDCTPRGGGGGVKGEIYALRCHWQLVNLEKFFKMMKPCCF
jgi:hypothetical protein